MTKLTGPEMETLSRLSQGYNQKEVAKQMKVSVQAVSQFVAKIRQKHRSLEKAMEWYREQNQDQFSADELPDEDEPQGPVRRCGRCHLQLPHETCTSAVEALDSRPANHNYALYSIGEGNRVGRGNNRG